MRAYKSRLLGAITPSGCAFVALRLSVITYWKTTWALVTRCLTSIMFFKTLLQDLEVCRKKREKEHSHRTLFGECQHMIFSNVLSRLVLKEEKVFFYFHCEPTMISDATGASEDRDVMLK